MWGVGSVGIHLAEGVSSGGGRVEIGLGGGWRVQWCKGGKGANIGGM